MGDERASLVAGARQLQVALDDAAADALLRLLDELLRWNAAYNLTIHTAASPTYTLRVMTVVAAIFVPAVLVYQAWSYHVFRRRLSMPKVGGAESADAVATADHGS